MKKKFIPADEIEAEAVKLLYEYGNTYSPAIEPPIPIDEICESYLGMRLEFDDLCKKYGNNVLAVTYILSNHVIIDATLDPDIHPNQEGRYYFTLAHEIGHIVLHKGEAIAVSDTPDMFGNVPPPVVCRSSNKDRYEIQADLFASYLLMPSNMIRSFWNKAGFSGRVNVYEELQNKLQQFGPATDEMEPISDYSKEMSKTFHVSMRAMQIRLKELNLLDVEKPTPEMEMGLSI
jgi:Zn-dependent peptidase ImmA (M78 family)